MDRLVSESEERPDIKILVDRAFARRYREDAQTEIDIGMRLNRLLSSGPDDEVITIPYTPNPKVATVDSIRDFRRLLRYAAEKCHRYTGGIHFRGAREKLVERNIAHEYWHVLGGIHEKHLRIRFGVQFIESKDGNQVSWMPSILFEGQTTRGVLRRMISGTTQLSKGDKIALGK